MAPTKRARTSAKITKTESHNDTTNVQSMNSEQTIIENTNDDQTLTTNANVDGLSTKKRGRRPRGSKIIDSDCNSEIANAVMPNVIVQFHCKLSDIEGFTNNEPLICDTDGQFVKRTSSDLPIPNNGSTVSNSVIPCDNTRVGELGFTYYDQLGKEELLLDLDEESVAYKMWASGWPNGHPRGGMPTTLQKDNVVSKKTAQVDTNDINEKIHEMEVNFHNNNTNGKRSACFWDTCQFDTPPFYIPKSMDANDVRPYGCFCSLNCALSYLQNEDIDASTKFERRQLLFNLYSNVIGEKTFVKPAPNPRYTLDKYYGNLTIQQWRSLLASDRMLLIVDKPLTPELPQLHTETTERFLTMGSTTATDVAQYGKFKIRKVAPKQSKGAIVAEKFGIASISSSK